MVDIITVLKTAPFFSAPHGRHPWAVFPKWGRLPFFLFDQWVGVWQACSPAMWMVRKGLCRPKFLTCSLCHGPSMWIQYVRLVLGGGSCTLTLCQTQVLWFSLPKFTLSIGELVYSWKKWYFPNWLLSFKWVSHGQNSKEKERWIAPWTSNK